LRDRIVALYRAPSGKITWLRALKPCRGEEGARAASVAAARNAFDAVLPGALRPPQFTTALGGERLGINMASRRSNRAPTQCESLASARHELISSDEDGCSPDEIQIVVAQLKRLTRTASLEFALRVGAVIIHHFYDGNIEGWRSRGPKEASFRRLARHPDLPLSAGSLCRCVALFELCERLDAASRWEHLGVSHLRAVLGLAPPLQESILSEANEKHWTVRALQQHLSRSLPTRLTSGGRRAEPALSKSLRNLDRCLEQHRSVLEEEPALSPRDLARMRRLLVETRQALDELSVLLDGPASSV
jgi:hypothetical protein